MSFVFDTMYFLKHWTKLNISLSNGDVFLKVNLLIIDKFKSLKFEIWKGMNMNFVIVKLHIDFS